MPETIEDARKRMIACALAFQASQIFADLHPLRSSIETLAYRGEQLDEAMDRYYEMRKTVG
jgi:hypothetical protein